MDDPRAAMTARAGRRLVALAGIACVALLTSAHVGSPNVLFDGQAGPYPVRVIIRPPMVVPGLAQVVVRAVGSDVDRVEIRPVFWRAGVRGAPEADIAERVSGEPFLFTGQLWLMQRGAYSVYVRVVGAKGAGETIVPVMSVATGRLRLTVPLGILLGALGVLLVVGVLSIVRAAVGESVLVPGEVADARARRRGWIGMAVALVVLGAAIFGGARWWGVVDRQYRQSIAVPFTMESLVITDSGKPSLELTLPLFVDRMMPDHGKLVHLFMVEWSGSTFAHLHPVRRAVNKVITPLPPLPPGKYGLFGDVVMMTGSEYTMLGTVDIPDTVRAPALLAPDDGMLTGTPAVAAAPGARAALGDGSSIEWNGEAMPVAGATTELRFTVRDSAGAIARVEPYLGMLGHAVVMRDDASVFIHLHPMGTVPVAAQEVFALRDRGDTVPDGRVIIDAPRAMPSQHHGAGEGLLAFPYEFPRDGRYRVWVQVRRNGRVLTAAFDLAVGAAR
jgi:hypothetical protein